jgi:hypothetical protein
MGSNKLCFRLIALIPVLLLLSGCLEYSITTQIMPDGKILRTVIVKGDSVNIFKGSFPLPADSSWTISTRLESRNEKDIKEGKVFVYEARKEFNNVEALNRDFFHDSTLAEHIAIKVTLNKKFSWFYNLYEYTETYSRLFPFRSEPVGDYLSENELRIHLANEKEIYYAPDQDQILFVRDTLDVPVLSKTDSLRFKVLRDSIEQKFESWQKINIYNDFYHLITVSLNKLGVNVDTTASRALFYRHLDREKTFETGIENDNAFINAASDYFKVDRLKLQATDPEGFANFKKKFRIAAYSLETYTNRVLMPGMIVSSNAGKSDLNVASWTFKIDNFYASDYTMVVVSRLVNKWFVVGTAVILILLIGVVLLRLFRKKILV